MTRRILMVEGNEDAHVAFHFARRHGLANEFEISPKDGFDDLMRVLAVQLKGSEVGRIGVIVDADEDCSNRWQSVRALLQRSGYKAIPDHLPTMGFLTSQSGLPHFGAWFMPNNALPGMLEDFVAFLVPASDPLLDRAKRSVAAIKPDLRRFPSQYVSKAVIHTWLAWQEWPGTPMGQAITKRYLNSDLTPGAEFLVWLRNCFDIAPPVPGQLR